MLEELTAALDCFSLPLPDIWLQLGAVGKWMLLTDFSGPSCLSACHLDALSQSKYCQQDKEGGAKPLSKWSVAPLFLSVSAKHKRPIQRKHMRKSCVPLSRSHPPFPAARACQGWPHGFLVIPVRYPLPGTFTRPIMAIKFLNALQASVLAHCLLVWPFHLYFLG